MLKGDRCLQRSHAKFSGYGLFYSNVIKDFQNVQMKSIKFCFEQSCRVEQYPHMKVFGSIQPVKIPSFEPLNPFSVVDASVRQNRFALIAPLTLVCVKNYFYFFSFAFRPLKPIKSISWCEIKQILLFTTFMFPNKTKTRRLNRLFRPSPGSRW